MILNDHSFFSAPQLKRDALGSPVECAMRTSLVSLLVATACSGEPPRDATMHQVQARPVAADEQSRPTGRDSLLKMLSDYGNSFGDDRAGITARMGPPVGVRVFDAKRSTYRYHPVVPLSGADSLVVLDYPTASFEMTPPNSDAPEEVLWTVRIWGVLPGLPPVIVPGQTTRSQLLALFGDPDHAPAFELPPDNDSSVVIYESPFGRFTELIGFFVVRDTVRLIRWQFRVG